MSTHNFSEEHRLSIDADGNLSESFKRLIATFEGNKVYINPMVEDSTIDTTELDIDTYGKEGWTHLFANLVKNPILAHVKIFRKIPVFDFSDNLAKLFDILSKTSTLQELEFSFFKLEEMLATQVLWDPPGTNKAVSNQLKVLRLERTMVHDSIFPIEFVESIVNHSNLTKLDWYDTNLSSFATSDIEERLAVLCQSPTIQELSFRGRMHCAADFNIMDSDLNPVFQALQQSTVLQEFHCNVLLNPSSLPLVVELLQSNTALSGLSLSIFPIEQDYQTMLLDGFMKNKSLSSFLNTGIRMEVSEHTQAMQVEFLRHNMEMVEFELFPLTEYHERATKMYLDLNLTGRKYIIDDSSDNNDELEKNTLSSVNDEWISFMAEHCDNLDFLFYGLSMRPALCRRD